MDLFNNFNPKFLSVLKISALVIFALVIVALAVRLVGSTISGVMPGSGYTRMASQDSFAITANKMSAGVPSISLRNVDQKELVASDESSVVGNAEEMEVTEYNAIIETRNLKDTCTKVLALKPRSDVIFENANEYERGCDFSFKVKRSSVSEVLNIIKELNPRDLNENTQTIKNLVDDYTSEVDILEKKMLSIESTLSDAIKAYDEISNIATKSNDAESLTKIISSKIGVIERLTQQRITVNAELERLKRAKAQQLDRLEYTYFAVRISENKFINQRDLKDSWKAAIKGFVSDINSTLQNISINLVSLLFVVLQYVLYFFILLFIAKYVWRAAKNIWTK